MRVLVTGSTQGIGKAIAEGFIKRGDEVIVHCSSDIAKAERICKEIGGCSAVVADLSKIEEIKSLRRKTGDVDCLILNASVQYKETWDNISEENIDKQFTVNVKSTLMLIQDYCPSMKKKGLWKNSYCRQRQSVPSAP